MHVEARQPGEMCRLFSNRVALNHNVAGYSTVLYSMFHFQHPQAKDRAGWKGILSSHCKEGIHPVLSSAKVDRLQLDSAEIYSSR